MDAHDRLLGAVLVGSKPEGEPYRPDERKQLAHSAQKFGLALKLARLGALEAGLAAPSVAPRRKRTGRAPRGGRISQ